VKYTGAPSRSGFVDVRISARAPDGTDRSFGDFVRAQLVNIPKRVLYPAAADALNRTAGRARTIGKRRVAVASKVPVSVVNEQVYVSPAAGRPGRLRVSLSWYHRGVSLPRLGARKAKENYLKGMTGKGRSRTGRVVTQKGLRAGAHFFPGGFLANSSMNDREHGFRRVGKERLPLKVLKVPLKETQQCGKPFGYLSRSYLQKRYNQEIAWRIKHMSLIKVVRG
jgi:hypothetical protein